jgi:hypothetical protein
MTPTARLPRLWPQTRKNAPAKRRKLPRPPANDSKKPGAALPFPPPWFTKPFAKMAIRSLAVPRPGSRGSASPPVFPWDFLSWSRRFLIATFPMPGVPSPSSQK